MGVIEHRQATGALPRASAMGWAKDVGLDSTPPATSSGSNRSLIAIAGVTEMTLPRQFLLVLIAATLSGSEGATSAWIRLPSTWAEYFGIHYSGSQEGMGAWWGTVRGYGGARVGLTTRSGEAIEGPFQQHQVAVQANDFTTTDGTPVLPLLEAADRRVTFIYGVQKLIRPTLEPFDRDLLYVTVRRLHAANPELGRRICWEVGNEVVGAHFDPKGIARLPENHGIKREDNFQGYDLDWKRDFYIEEYLAPAVEAIRRAAQEVYGDPRTIRILLGSMNPYNKPNRAFLEKTMAATFTGRQAPSLAGHTVASQIDALNVHYMFSTGRENFDGVLAKTETMQCYVDQYLRTGLVKRLWITEEYGGVGKGGVSIVAAGFRFLAWVAANRLDSEQTRVIWYGDKAEDGGGRAAVELLGRFLEGRRLDYRCQAESELTLHLLHATATGKDPRLLAALIPSRPFTGTISLALPEGLAPGSITLVRYAAEAAPRNERLTVTLEDRRLDLKITEAVAEPALLLISTADDVGALER